MSKIISMIERIRYNIHGLFLAVKFLCAKNTFLFLPFRYINISLRARACVYVRVLAENIGDEKGTNDAG